MGVGDQKGILLKVVFPGDGKADVNSRSVDIKAGTVRFIPWKKYDVASVLFGVVKWNISVALKLNDRSNKLRAALP